MKTKIRIFATSALLAVVTGLCMVSLASCNGNGVKTSSGDNGGLGSTPGPVTLTSIDQCATASGTVIVGIPGTTSGAKPGCQNVNAVPGSTKAFAEIQVKNGGLLGVPGTTSGAHTLTVGDICLESGSQFLIGSPSSPITSSNQFTIVFTGSTSSTGSTDSHCQDSGPSHTGPFKKGIDVTSGATLELYGAKGIPQNGGVSWTTLVKPAGPQTAGVAVTSSGPQTLYLTADVTKGKGPNGENEGWQPGDWIVVATSDFVPWDTEFVQIASVTSGSNGVQGANSKVTLTQALKYYHFGSLAPSPATATCPDPLSKTNGTQPAFLCDGASQNYGVDERAEVGLISRNITLTAETATIVPPSSITNPNIDAATINEHWGGEIKIHHKFTQVVIQGVRLSKFGKPQIGSYPIHFHQVGTINSGSQPVLVDADSVDHSYNKCVTIHDTSNLTISNMVCARIVGHIFYEELGDATANNVADDSGITYENNLGLGAMSNYFDINKLYTIAPSSATSISRATLIQDYWWTGDNMTNDPSSSDFINYDGFNIPDTDNQLQTVHGSCYSYGSIGPLVNNGAPNGTCAQGQHYDEPASGFWIQNPGTILIGNAIGGCQGVGAGYWWVTPQTALTVNGQTKNLAYVRLGTVKDNRAHACYNGFFDDGTPGGLINVSPLFPHKDPVAGSPSVIATLHGVTATRNRFRGLWLRSAWIAVENGHFATNRDNVTLLTSGGIDGNAPGAWNLVQDSVVVGLSMNNPGRFGPCPNPGQIGSQLIRYVGSTFGCIDYTPASSAHSGDIYDQGYQDPKWNSAGYYLYDGPVRVFHDRFVRFNYNAGWTTSMPCSGTGAGTYYTELDDADCKFLQSYETTYSNANNLPKPAPYEGDAALGWFTSNQNSYPTGTASKQLMFVDTNLRHQVFTAQVGIGGFFNDGDKNTSVIDEDGTLDGLGVQLAPNSGTHPAYPISLNNLPFNSTSNSVDECLSRGAQNQHYEGRTSALMSPASMGTLQFSSLYPYMGSSYPGSINSHWQTVTFTRDDAVSDGNGGTFHPTMAMQTGRGGLGSYEPKVSNGYGYYVTVSPTPYSVASSAINTGKAGLWKWVDVTLADIVDPNITQKHPFYIRLGIDYKSTTQDGATVQAPPPSTSYFTIKRGYKSYVGQQVWQGDPQLLQYWTALNCTDLDASHPGNLPTDASGGGGYCPGGTSTTLTSVSSISGLMTKNSDGTYTPLTDVYYYNPSTGYLYLNIVQDTPNPIAASPTGSCDSTYDGGTPDPACPDAAAGETYYACPKSGCVDYTIAVQAPPSSTSSYTYTPGPSTGRPDPANLIAAPTQQNKLLVIRGSNAGTVVAPAIATDDQGVPYYTATNSANACTTTQP